MRVRITLLMAVLALASVAVMPSAAADSTRTVVKNYELGLVGDITAVCRQTSPSIGGACFGLDFGERTVTVTIQDDENSPIAAFYDFTDPLGTAYGSGDICQAATLPIPTGATELVIYLEWAGGIIFSPCGLDSQPPTSGTITAEFYRP